MDQQALFQFFSGFFDILGFTGNREALTKAFFTTIQRILGDTIAATLPKEKQAVFSASFSNTTSTEHLQRLCLEYVDQKTYAASLLAAAQKTFALLFSSLQEPLTPAQAQLLQAYFLRQLQVMGITVPQKTSRRDGTHGC